jgi:two-component system sensor histidine kinase UhpB
MEDALKESEQRYALATAAGAVGVWDWNLETNDIYVEPKLKAMLGFDDAEIPNRLQDWGARVHPDDRDLVMTRAQACIDGKVDVYEVQHRMVHKDGGLRWFLARGSLVKHANGTPHRMVGTDTDITETKQIEEAVRRNESLLQATNRQIQDLAGRLIASQEVERARIARDLHDGLSQELAGLSIALSGLKRRVGTLPDGADMQSDVSSLQSRAMTLAQNIRHLSHDLHPSVLEHAGLVAALAAHCSELKRQRNVDVSFSAEGDLETTERGAALCLYRVAQEALRNVVTHAQARHAEVRLLGREDGIELSVIDDGKGFNARENGRGLGLISMTERVRAAGGTVRVLTELNRGTTVHVQLARRPPSEPAAAGTHATT